MDQQNLVACSSFDYLVNQIVQYQLKSSEDGNRKLDAMGFNIGQRLSERYTLHRAPFGSVLDIIKFICKELWLHLYAKQVDNLATNNKGVFVVTDKRYPLLLRLSAGPDVNVQEAAQKYLTFPCGIIRGALERLGVNARVSADIKKLPVVHFKITLNEAVG